MSRRATLASFAILSACASTPHATRHANNASSSPPPASVSSSPPSASASPAPAVTMMSSEPYRFEFGVPDGWTTMTEEQARRVHRDARFGFSAPDASAIALITIVPVPRTMTFDQGADRWAATLHGDQPRVVSAARLRWSNRDAARVTLEARNNNTPFRVDAILFQRERHLYAVQLVHATTSTVDPDQLFAGFHPTDGAVTQDDIDVPVTAVDGPGWRIQNGRYEDIASGITIEAHDGWSFLDRWPTRDLGADLDIALRANGQPIYVMFSTEHVPAAVQTHWGQLLDEQISHRYALASGRPSESYQIDGAPIELRVMSSGDEEMLVGRACHENTCATFIERYPATMAAEARALISRSGPTVRWMAARDRAALARHLPGSVRNLNVVGVDDAFREGHYTDYAHGVRFALPDDGAWEVQIGREARQIGANLQVTASDRTRDVRLALIVETVAEGTSDEVTHRQLRESFHADTSVHPHERRIGSVRVLESDVLSTTEGNVAYHLVTAVRGTTSVRFEIAGLAENMTPNRRLVETLARSFDIAPGPIERTHREGDRYVAEQLGYALNIPADWAHEQSIIADGLHADRWSHGTSVVFMLVQGPADRPDGSRGPDSLLATLSAFDASAPPASAWSALTFAGHPAASAVWTDTGRGVHGWRIDASRTGYLLFSTDEPAGAADALAHTLEILH